MTTHEEEKEWCRLLKHTCDPGCKGCVLYGMGFFSQENTPSNQAFEKRQAKNRTDDPLGGK